MVILDGSLHAVGDDHRPCFAAYFAGIEHLFGEVIHNYLGFETDGVFVAFHITAQLFLSFLGIVFRVVRHDFGQKIVAFHRRVVG